MIPAGKIILNFDILFKFNFVLNFHIFKINDLIIERNKNACKTNTAQ